MAPRPRNVQCTIARSLLASHEVSGCCLGGRVRLPCFLFRVPVGWVPACLPASNELKRLLCLFGSMACVQLLFSFILSFFFLPAPAAHHPL